MISYVNCLYAEFGGAGFQSSANYQFRVAEGIYELSHHKLVSSLIHVRHTYKAFPCTTGAHDTESGNKSSKLKGK